MRVTDVKIDPARAKWYFGQYRARTGAELSNHGNFRPKNLKSDAVDGGQGRPTVSTIRNSPFRYTRTKFAPADFCTATE